MENKLNHNLKDDLKIKQLWNLFEEIQSKSPSDSIINLNFIESHSQFEADLEIKSFRYSIDKKISEISFKNIMIEIRRSFLQSLSDSKKISN